MAVKKKPRKYGAVTKEVIAQRNKAAKAAQKKLGTYKPTKTSSKKKAHPLKGRTLSKEHRAAISEGMKRHHAGKKKPSAARTKTGKIKTDKKTLASAHNKLNAAQNRSKVRQLEKQIKQLRERITMTNGHGKRATLFNQIDSLKAQIAKLK